jgi:hypothetical protein
MSESKKAAIIESLFNGRWQGKGKPLLNSLVTLTDVSRAIQAYNASNKGRELSAKNPANFFKDFFRIKRSANKNWPGSVLTRGYTAHQVTGKGLCFEFSPIQPGQTEPFPISGIHVPGPSVPKHQIQSASMPLASRRLGRGDEAWLIQVLVKLHVIETHLALRSPRKFVQVDLLQTNIKLARTEIDALFLGFEELPDTDPQELREIIITCEAKGRSDDILEDQLLAQVKATFGMHAIHQGTVVPIAVKAIAPSKVYVVQFAPVNRADVPGLLALSVESEAVYELLPSVPGVGK